MSHSIVEVMNLTKCFVHTRFLHQIWRGPFTCKEKIHALRGVSFAVAAGEILGLVGPNGAGKTTLLRLIADLLKADEGSVRLCGHELSALGHLARARIGYVSNDERSFFWRLTGVQNLEFFGSLYGLSRTEARRRINELLGRFSLERQARRPFREVSSGTRKKFALIRALLHEPRLLLLDEVTNSLDPSSVQSVKRLVRDYVSSGTPRGGVWSTHRLEEIDEICDRVLLIDRGRTTLLDTARATGALAGPPVREMAVFNEVT
jgi:ABC-2 type transport system ATP-binding protein